MRPVCRGFSSSKCRCLGPNSYAVHEKHAKTVYVSPINELVRGPTATNRRSRHGVREGKPLHEMPAVKSRKTAAARERRVFAFSFPVHGTVANTDSTARNNVPDSYRKRRRDAENSQMPDKNADCKLLQAYILKPVYIYVTLLLNPKAVLYLRCSNRPTD